jgi:hypothetical protein
MHLFLFEGYTHDEERNSYNSYQMLTQLRFMFIKEKSILQLPGSSVRTPNLGLTSRLTFLTKTQSWDDVRLDVQYKALGTIALERNEPLMGYLKCMKGN